MNKCVICSTPISLEIRDHLKLSGDGWVCSFGCFSKALDILPEQTKFERELVDILSGISRKSL